MYTQHFRLSEPPFSIAPNPRYLFLSPKHREGLAHLLYGIGAGGGFVVLTGEVGTGKTTLCRCLLEQLPEDVDLALVFNPRLNSRELLAVICDELRVAHSRKTSLKELIDLLNRHLLDAHARGRRTIVLIDEAQNLRHDVLEQIRLLTNLETNRAKLVQILLVAQPELNRVLERPQLRQLAQRVTARYHLKPLSLAETRDYIRHRLAVAGHPDPLFSGAAIRAIHREARGIPRLINLIADRALLGAYGRNRRRVNWFVARRAAREMAAPGAPARPPHRAVALAGLLALAVAAWWLENPADGPLPARPEPAAAAPLVAPEPTAAPASVPAAPLALAQTAPPAAAPAPPGPATPTETPGPPANGASAAPSGAGEAPAAVPPNAATAPPPPPPGEPPPAPPTPAQPPEPAPVPFADWVRNPALTRPAALAGLFALWKLAPPGDRPDPCALAQNQGPRCLETRGHWFPLRSLNLPALLEFRLADGARRYATLTRLTDGRLELAAENAAPVRFELAEILPFWTGEALLLWKPPHGEAGPLALGSRSGAVPWLRQRLGGAPVPAGQETLYDAALAARIAAFQTERGLTADAVIGARTLIYLGMAENDPTVPRLDTLSR